MANWVRYPLPLFWALSPWRACEVEVRYPPLKRSISAILVRYPMKTRQTGAIPHSAILSRKGIARYGGVSRIGPLRKRKMCRNMDRFSESPLCTVFDVRETWRHALLYVLRGEWADWTLRCASRCHLPTIPTGKDTCAFFCFRTWITNSIHIHICEQFRERFWIRCIYLAGTYLVLETNTHTWKISWPMSSNSIRIHIRLKIAGNSKYIHSRMHGNPSAVVDLNTVDLMALDDCSTIVLNGCAVGTSACLALKCDGKALRAGKVTPSLTRTREKQDARQLVQCSASEGMCAQFCCNSSGIPRVFVWRIDGAGTTPIPINDKMRKLRPKLRPRRIWTARIFRVL